ncbi:hypothetical protein [Castellaniella sp.]|uniref:hypothetical protein n=1 Tax=Castellaniella sp. TaxID=1955812 RepID=UPI002AFEE363|nr:hypothetical protein [Castellaniella sp.]
MKPSERYAWIEEYLHGKLVGESVDVLDKHFFDAYIEATGAKCSIMIYGADKCQQLGRDLSGMHKMGRLTRHATGLEGMAGMGFPRWVYVYRLPR